MKSLHNLTASQLRRRAADLKEKIHKLQKQQEVIAGGEKKTASFQNTKRARRKFSADGIVKIRAAKKARLAVIKAARPLPIPPVKKYL